MILQAPASHKANIAAPTIANIPTPTFAVSKAAAFLIVLLALLLAALWLAEELPLVVLLAVPVKLVKFALPVVVVAVTVEAPDVVMVVLSLGVLLALPLAVVEESMANWRE